MQLRHPSTPVRTPLAECQTQSCEFKTPEAAPKTPTRKLTTASVQKTLLDEFEAAAVLTTPSPAALKQRRKKKSTDGPFNPRSENRKTDALAMNSEGLLKSRCDTKEIVATSEDEDMEALKTAALYFGSPLRQDPDKENKKIIDALAKKTSEIPSHRPIADIVEYSQHQSPTVIKTPHGTRLHRDAQMGSVSVFSNRQESRKRKPPQIHPDFFESDEFKNVLPASDALKRQLYQLTQKQMDDVLKEKNKNNGHRSVSQKDVMRSPDVAAKEAVSASQYAHAAGVVPMEVKSEFAHLGAHEHLGAASQAEKNMGITTKAANTVSMIHEKQVKMILREYPDVGVTILVEGFFIASTQLLEKIEYTVEAPHFRYFFSVDGQQLSNPMYASVKYWDALVQSLIEVHAAPAVDQQAATVAPIDQASQHILFFKRKKQKVDEQQKTEVHQENENHRCQA